MTRRRTILIGMAAGLLWAVLVILFGRTATVGFVPLPIVVPVATVLPGLVLAAIIGRIAQRRFFDDALIDGDRPPEASRAEIDRRVLLNTVEQCVLALLLWPFVAYTLGGSLVLVMSAAFALARIGGADVFAIKIEQSGGLRAAQQVAAIGDAAGIELYGGTMLEGAIGTIASAHAFATFRELQWGTELFGPLLLTEEILAEPLQYQDFQLAIPNRPGLGIVLDEERVQYFRRDRKQGATVTAARPATLAG